MIPKPRRTKSKQAIEDARCTYCEYCGKGGSVHVHHVVSRGAGGGDTADNLISLCIRCHARTHSGEIPRVALEQIVGGR